MPLIDGMNKIERHGNLMVTLKQSDSISLGVLNDIKILELCEKGMITPFEIGQVRKGVISYGLSSFGYDFRIGNTARLFVRSPDFKAEVDPKNFSDSHVTELSTSNYFVMPPHSFMLSHSVEIFNMPDDVMGICLGKSTYARVGIILNITPAEPAWRGQLTIEITNSTPLPCRVYANEGISQMIFLRGEKPAVSYAQRKGKYQDQEGTTYAKV